MAALVADYGESDSDTDVSECAPLTQQSTPPHTNLLISHDADEIINPEVIQEADNGTNREQKDKLPNPLAKKAKKSKVLKHLSQSVFVNPFDEAKREKDSVLEKHVKMTDTPDAKPKKICYKFQKGICLYEKGCRFSHDIAGKPGAVKNDVKFANNRRFKRNDVGGVSPDDDSYMANMKRKQRAGVNDMLVPPKRAMNLLAQQRVQERPWTISEHGK